MKINFIKFGNAFSYTSRCSGLVFLSYLSYQDTFKDFIRFPLPSGVLSVLIVDREGATYQTLTSSDFSYANSTLSLDFTFSPLTESRKELRFSVLVDNVELLASDYFYLDTNTYELNLSTRVRYADDTYPNDYVELRLPIKALAPTLADNGSSFETSDDELIRPVNKSQVELDLLAFNHEFLQFQTILWEMLRQRYARIELDGNFHQVIFENEFDIETFNQVYDNPFESSGQVIAKVKLNGVGVEEQTNVVGVLSAEPYANASVVLYTANQAGDTTFSYDILLDKALPQSQTVTYQVIGIGGNPAEAIDFTGSVFPSGSITFGPYSMQAELSIGVEAGANIVDGTHFEIIWTDSDLIKFPSTSTKLSLVGSLDFGTIVANSQKSLTATINNVTTDEILNVTSITVPAQYSVSPSRLTLLPGKSEALTITFSPTSNGTYNGNLTAFLDDSTNRTLAVSGVAGNTGGGGSSIEPMTFDSTIAAGATVNLDHNFALTNIRDYVYNISDASTNESISSGLKVVAVNSNRISVTNEGGASVTVRITLVKAQV